MAKTKKNRAAKKPAASSRRKPRATKAKATKTRRPRRAASSIAAGKRKRGSRDSVDVKQSKALGRVSTVTPSTPAEIRPSPVDVPLGQGQMAFVRFDTPKSRSLKALIEGYQAKKATTDDAKKFATFKWACFELLKVGVEVASQQNLWPKESTPDEVDVKGAIDAWAANKWPEAEDRPKLKALIFQLLAIGIESADHQPKKKKAAGSRKKVGAKSGGE